MKFSRRHFCSALAIGSTGVVGETVSAQSEVQITGTIDSAVGADVEGVELFFQHVDTGWYQRYTIPASGDIDLTVPQTGEFIVRLDNTSTRNENVPLLYSFGSTTVERTGTSVTYTIPQPYDVTIQCVDGKGAPIERLPIRLRTGGYSHAPGVLTTSERGYVTSNRTEETPSQPVLQLVGPTSVEVSKNDMRQPLGEITVTESAEYEFEVTNIETYTPNYTLIEADRNKGFNYPYLLYNPPAKENYKRPIFVQTLNADNVQNRKELTAQTKSAGENYLYYPRELSFPGIVAGFPRTPKDGPDIVQALSLEADVGEVATEEFPEESLKRVDRQLVNMIDDAKSRLSDENYPISDQVHMSGFSSGGTFASRFSFLHPGLVSTVTKGGDGAAPLPISEYKGTTLPYPLGTADYEEITGREFDREEWASIDLFFYNGEDDQPSPEDGSSYYQYSRRYYDKVLEVFGENQITERLPVTKSVYNEYKENVKFRVYEGVGHTTTPETSKDVLSFHRENWEYEPTNPSDDVNTNTSDKEPLSSSDEKNTDTTSEETPGLGIEAAVAGVGGSIYLFKQKFETTETTERDGK